MLKIHIFIRLTLITVLFAAIFLFLRSVPIVDRVFPAENKQSGEGIFISEPRYLVPREFVFPSVFSGGNIFIPFRDPHFRTVGPIQFEVTLNNEVHRVEAVGFDINKGFSNYDLHKHYLAVRVDDQILKYDAGETCFTCWASRTQLFALGQTQDWFVFLLNKPFGYDLMNMKSEEHGLLAIEFPFVSNSSGVLTPVSSELAEQLISEIKSYPQSIDAFDEICASRTIPLGIFLNDRFGYRCDWL